MKKIYLAVPFMHKNPLIRFLRFYKVTKKCAQLIKEGNVVFSPISHCFFMYIFEKMPGTWEFWEKQDLSYLNWCDELHVLKLNGWRNSEGVSAEIKYIQSKNKPVIYINE